MVRGTNELIKWIEFQKAGYWKIYPGGTSRNTYLAESGDQDSISIDQSIERLRYALGILSQGRYTVVCKAKASDTKAFAETAYEHDGVPASSNMNANMTQGSISGLLDEAAVDKRIAAALEAQANKLELDRLQKELAEAQKEIKELNGNGAAAAWDRIIQRIEPHIGTVLNAYLPPAPKAATIAAVGYKGTEEQKENLQKTTSTMELTYTVPQTLPATQEEAADRVEKALDAWSKKDPEFMLRVLEKITETAYADEATYKFYVNALLK